MGRGLDETKNPGKTAPRNNPLRREISNAEDAGDREKLAAYEAKTDEQEIKSQLLETFLLNRKPLQDYIASQKDANWGQKVKYMQDWQIWAEDHLQELARGELLTKAIRTTAQNDVVLDLDILAKDLLDYTENDVLWSMLSRDCLDSPRETFSEADEAAGLYKNSELEPLLWALGGDDVILSLREMRKETTRESWREAMREQLRQEGVAISSSRLEKLLEGGGEPYWPKGELGDSYGYMSYKSWVELKTGNFLDNLDPDTRALAESMTSRLFREWREKDSNLFLKNPDNGQEYTLTSVTSLWRTAGGTNHRRGNVIDSGWYKGHDHRGQKDGHLRLSELYLKDGRLIPNARFYQTEIMDQEIRVESEERRNLDGRSLRMATDYGSVQIAQVFTEKKGRPLQSVAEIDGQRFTVSEQEVARFGGLEGWCFFQLEKMTKDRIARAKTRNEGRRKAEEAKKAGDTDLLQERAQNKQARIDRLLGNEKEIDISMDKS